MRYHHRHPRYQDNNRYYRKRRPFFFWIFPALIFYFIVTSWTGIPFWILVLLGFMALKMMFGGSRRSHSSNRSRLPPPQEAYGVPVSYVETSTKTHKTAAKPQLNYCPECGTRASGGSYCVGCGSSLQ